MAAGVGPPALVVVVVVVVVAVTAAGMGACRSGCHNYRRDMVSAHCRQLISLKA